jgi:hypothetical protein
MENVILVIDQALDMATRKGVFGLKDASVLSQAMTLLKQHHGIEEPDAQKAVKEDLPKKESAAKKSISK